MFSKPLHELRVYKDFLENELTREGNLLDQIVRSLNEKQMVIDSLNLARRETEQAIKMLEEAEK